MTKITEIRNGEVTSRRAKLVLYPIILLYVADFISMFFHMGATGYSGITSGTLEPGGYSVVEHGHAIHVTVTQYWLGRAQMIILVVGLATWFIARAYFFHTGDLRREKPAA
jgi:hypothetical protein